MSTQVMPVTQVTRVVRVGFLNTGRNFLQFLRGALERQESKDIEVKYVSGSTVSSQADVVIFSFDGAGASAYRGVRGKRVMICGEPNQVTMPGLALVIDCKNDVRRSVLRGTASVYVPWYATSFCERFHHTPQDLLKPAGWSPPTKTKFCAYMYRAIHAHRERLFDAVNSYRAVDALGKSKSNGRGGKDRTLYKWGVKTYLDAAVETYRPYKFVICCENVIGLKGYVTEKIVNAMLAGCIPVYWGAEEVVEHFNPKSFINVGSFESLHAALEEVKRIDTDQDAYTAMLQEPWMRDNRLNAYFDPTRLNESLGAVVEGAASAVSSVTKRAVGTNKVTAAKTVRDRRAAIRQKLSRS